MHRAAIVSCIVVAILGSTSVFAQWNEPTVTASNRASQPVFLVSSSTPYRFPPTPAASLPSLSATQMGQLAASRSGVANSVTSDSKSRSMQSQSQCKDSDSEKEILSAFQGAVAHRLRQTAAANAMKLHYGIAACLNAERIFNETLTRLDEQSKAQTQLVETGIPIPDPLFVDRLKIALEDKRLENHSKMAVLRTQLSALVGTENACGHSPLEDQEIIPSDRGVCEHIDQALVCRCDLTTMKHLRGTINSGSLPVWDRLGAMLSGVPSLAKQKSLWSRVLLGKSSREEIDCAVSARRNWLDNVIAEQTRQVTMEVEVAFEKKKTAALRWVKAKEQIANWESRIKQLEMLSEVQGNLAGQFEANLNRLQAEGPRIERWLEWHLANVDLMLAVGCDL